MDNKVTFILDEFGNLGRVSKLIKATTISRSYKLNQIFILQDLSQIEAIYSKEERGILEANTAYKIILQQNNLETARRISDLIGNKTEIRTSKSEQEEGLKGAKSSYSSSYESIPLVTPQDILNLKKNECITVVQGFAANVIFAKIPWYFQNKIQ
jgi:type IV secretion system protein VirD4